MDLSDKDLVVIKKALQAYSAHLAPSSSFVPSVAVWQKEVDQTVNKVIDLLLKK
jgi:hypothetical protein